MKKLKKPSCAMLVAIMLLTNSNGVFAYANTHNQKSIINTEEQVNTSSNKNLKSSDSEIINIPDENLVKSINKKLGKPIYSDITKSELESFEELDIGYSQISNLEGLQYCINLKKLDLSANDIEDLEPISNLKNLESLRMFANNKTDKKDEIFKPLVGLTNLKKLDLSSQGGNFNNHFIEDLTYIGQLKSLTHLNLRSNVIKDISPLYNLTNLVDLSLTSNCIDDINGIEKLENLESLNLYYNNIIDFSPLKKLDKLKQCRYGSQQKSLEPLFVKNIQDKDIEIDMPLVYDHYGNKINLKDMSNKFKLSGDKIILQNIDSTKQIKMLFEHNCDLTESGDGIILLYKSIINLVDGVEVIESGFATEKEPTIFEITSMDGLNYMLSELDSLSTTSGYKKYKLINEPEIKDGFKIYNIELEDYDFRGANNQTIFNIKLKVNLNNKEIIDSLDSKLDDVDKPSDGGGNTQNPGTEPEIKPPVDIIKPIQGVIVIGKGEASIELPVVLFIENEDALNKLLELLETNFTYKIVGKPRIENNDKIYKLELVYKKEKSSKEPKYLELRFSKDDKSISNILNNKLGIGDSQSTEDKPPIINIPSINIPSDEETDNKPVVNNSFNDIKSHWALEEINEFVNKGYISGYSDNTFRPNEKITRAEFITIVNKVFGFTEKGTENFEDVSDIDWFYKDILVAMKVGYINGYKDNTFRPNEYITREEAAKIINNIHQEEHSNFDKVSGFIDKEEISTWAIESIESMLENGYMKGYKDNTIKPKNKITRAEAVCLLNEIDSKIN